MRFPETELRLNDFMSGVKWFSITSDFPLWSFVFFQEGLNGTAPLAARGCHSSALTDQALSTLNLSLNHWWNLTGCNGIWNWVHLKYISAEKSFAWKNQGLILKKKRCYSEWHFCSVCIIVVMFLQTIFIMIL